MSSVTVDHIPPHAGHDEHAHHVPHGWRRWVFATNHKDIGTMYLIFSFCMLLEGGTLALLLRTELFEPGIQFFQPELFNQFTTMHGLIMIFGAIMPAFVGFANWMIPLQIGASDMAFARMNNFSFWLLPVGAILLTTSFFVPGGANASGWTMYAPLSLQMGPGMDFAIFAVHILGASSIMGAINIIVTILNMRAPGMTLMKMPLFCWSWLVTAYLLLAVMPVLAAAVTMLLTDRHFGTHFFNAAGGGDPVLYQHVFWFFGHPEVYIMILPAFGMVSQIVPTFARKRLFGYASMVYAICAIAILSFLVWAHHMFTTGMPVTAQLFFMYGTMLISIPTGVKVFNWTATMWRGSMTFETPMLFAIGFIFVFTIGGFTGLVVAVAPIDIQVQDAVRPVRRHLLLAAEMVRPHVRRAPGQVALLDDDDLVQRHLLPDALPRPGRHAAPLRGLRRPVHRLPPDRHDRRLLVRPVAAAVRLHRDQGVPRPRRPGGGQALGRRRRPGMDGALARALPHLRHAAHPRGRPLRAPDMTPEQRRRNRRTGWILALFAVAILVWTFVRANLYGIAS